MASETAAANPRAARYEAWYFAGVASFMLPAGIHAVLLPYLLTLQLQQSAERYGVTQMLGQLPLLLLLLVGGWLADRVDPRRLLVALQLLAVLAPSLLVPLLLQGRLEEWAVLIYAIAWGTVSAFAMPARDGLLNRVASGNVQRTVTWTMAVQFGAQVIGYGIAGQAEQWGAVPVLLTQCLVLALGTVAALRLPSRAVPPASAPAGPAAPSTERGAASLISDITSGIALLFAAPSMRATFLLTAGLGVFFAGTFVVLLPLAVRDLYAGNAADISNGFMAFVAGTLISIFALMRHGGLRYPGRALVTVLYFGCLVLLPICLGPPLWLFYVCIFCWGIGGGIAMTMARTIMQEHAPPTHRARVMAAFSLANAGGAPIGSLLMGFAVSASGVRAAVLLPIAGVAITTTLVLLTHPLWRLQSTSAAPTQSDPRRS